MNVSAGQQQPDDLKIHLTKVFAYVLFSTLTTRAKGKTVDAKSILMILAMGLVKGTEITICADGSDEADAVKEFKALVDAKFGEDYCDDYSEKELNVDECNECGID